jgi:predicted dehydrogenase
MSLRWGILGTSRIARTQVIPAFLAAGHRVVAIASREADRAADAARALGIPKPYGDYGEMLEDPEIDAIYNPLPNHLHLWWTLSAIAAGS